ncbi:hypothetical protein TRAPUB_3384 [Trametes pubescens]|uniref:Uncharacterized protein n=1 Tax=Trametes pubescens TaxID=154538 RepID=A0A1M2VDU8_TRAPU|nr:hypothetical protein TRAPUB_3384 [Trametes pubescens]
MAWSVEPIDLQDAMLIVHRAQSGSVAWMASPPRMDRRRGRSRARVRVWLPYCEQGRQPVMDIAKVPQSALKVVTGNIPLAKFEDELCQLFAALSRMPYSPFDVPTGPCRTLSAGHSPFARTSISTYIIEDADIATALFNSMPAMHQQMVVLSEHRTSPTRGPVLVAPRYAFLIVCIPPSDVLRLYHGKATLSSIRKVGAAAAAHWLTSLALRQVV